MNRKGRMRSIRPFSLSKNFVEFRRKAAKQSKICFLERHVRDRKHFSGRKRGSRPPLADSECAAAPCKKLAEKANAFFDKLKGRMRSIRPFSLSKNFVEFRRKEAK